MGLGYGIVSGNTDCVIEAGIEYEDQAERAARIYTEQFDVPFGYVKLESGFDFEMKKVKWTTRSLFEDWIVALKANPYLNIGEHKDLIIICCEDINYANNWDGFGDDIVCLLEKNECKRLAKRLFGVTEFKKWLTEEYTADQSKDIVDFAIQNGKCVKIWK